MIQFDFDPSVVNSVFLLWRSIKVIVDKQQTTTKKNNPPTLEIIPFHIFTRKTWTFSDVEKLKICMKKC